MRAHSILLCAACLPVAWSKTVTNWLPNGYQMMCPKWFTGKVTKVSRVFSNDLLGANTSFQGFPNGLLAHLGSASHPSQPASARPATCPFARPPARPPASSACGHCGARLALRPAHGPLGCGSSDSGVMLTLIASVPLGLHVALDLSPIDALRPPASCRSRLCCPGGRSPTIMYFPMHFGALR